MSIEAGPTDDDLIEALKALAHPMRMRIVRALGQGELSVSEIEEKAGIAQPTLSQQLAVLRQARLVQTRRQAKRVHYRLDRERMQAIASNLADPTGALDEPVAGQAAQSWGAANFARLIG